jgi:methionyl-tRNA formyltransferase
MSSVRLRVAFFGLPLGALALHQAGVSCCVIGLGHPDAPGARRVRRNLSRHTLVLAKPDLATPEITRILQAARPDVLLSWFWPWRIPEHVLALCPRGAWGVHPSLLPRWRGPDPYFWALFRGDSHTGVSLHGLAAEYDTGPLVAQLRVPIDPETNAWRLAKTLDRPSLALLVEAARTLQAGEPLCGVPQDHIQATAAPRPDEDLLALRWDDPAPTLVAQVRALAPEPGAGTRLGDEDVEVLAAHCYRGKLPRALSPGDAVLSSEGVVIKARDGALVLERVRREDGKILRGQAIAGLFRTGLFRLPE